MSVTQKTYNVVGMTCGHCELSVRDEVEEVHGVTAADADHRTGRLTVRGEDVREADLQAAVEAAGYALEPPTASS